MLVLSRKVGERVIINGSIVVTVIATQGRMVKIGVEAPPEVVVLREELVAQAGTALEAKGGPAVVSQPRLGSPTQDRK